jgi:hypothetical protein
VEDEVIFIQYALYTVQGNKRLSHLTFLIIMDVNFYYFLIKMMKQLLREEAI